MDRPVVPELYVSRVTISHWLPILTICPVNNLPDLLFVRVTFQDEFQELYAIRRSFRALNFRRCFMEDIAEMVAARHPSAVCVEVRLLFSKHVVKLEKKA